MKFIDTHAHLCDAKLPDAKLVVENFKSQGVEKVINMVLYILYCFRTLSSTKLTKENTCNLRTNMIK